MAAETDPQSQTTAPSGATPATDQLSDQGTQSPDLASVAVQSKDQGDQSANASPVTVQTSNSDNQSRNVVPATDQPDDSVNQQIAMLEQKLADMASKGINVQRASRILDALCDKLNSSNTNQPVSVNYDLNLARYELALAPSEQKFSSGNAPLWIALYEISVFIIAIMLLIVHHRYLMQVLVSQQQWSIVITWSIAAIAGLIGAAMHTMYSLYRHKVIGNVDPKYVVWYLLRPVVGGISAGFIGIASTIILNGISDNGVGEQLAIILLGFLSGVSERFTNKVISMLSNKFTAGNTPTHTPQNTTSSVNGTSATL